MKENELQEKLEEALISREKAKLWGMLGWGVALTTLVISCGVTYLNHKDSEKVMPAIPASVISYSVDNSAPSKNKLYHGSPEEIWAKMHPEASVPYSEPTQRK